MHYTATVVGATGLVGSHLVKALCHDDNCMAIHILARRKTDFTDPKIKEYIIDFDQQSAYEKYIQGDVLFSCLGTNYSCTSRQCRKTVQSRLWLSISGSIAC